MEFDIFILFLSIKVFFKNPVTIMLLLSKAVKAILLFITGTIFSHLSTKIGFNLC